MKEKKPKKERKFTQKELRRKARFDAVCAQMESDGYAKTLLTVDAAKANALAMVVMLPFVIVAVAAYLLTAKGKGSINLNIFAFLLLIAVCTVIHEGIHGLTWGCFAKSGFRSIDFGMIWSMLAPYCTCSEPLGKGVYLLGGVMPTLVLGPALTAAACVTGNFTLLMTAVVMILGGGVDSLIALKILLHRAKGGEVLFYDRPTEPGLVVFEK